MCVCVCVGACSCMPSRSHKVRRKIRARVEKDDLASIISNRLSNICHAASVNDITQLHL